LRNAVTGSRRRRRTGVFKEHPEPDRDARAGLRASPLVHDLLMDPIRKPLAGSGPPHLFGPGDPRDRRRGPQTMIRNLTWGGLALIALITFLR
jgi:hypothetical protein